MTELQDRSLPLPLGVQPIAEEVTVIRVAKSTVWVFSIIFLPLLIWGSSLVWNTPRVAEGTLCISGYVFLLYWICSRTIELASGRIVYKTIFKREDIDLYAVSRISSGADPAPFLSFKLTEKEKRPFTFRIKPFSRNGIVAILYHARRFNPSIRFDAVTEDMSKADFGSITRETLASRNLLAIAMLSAAITLGAALIKVCLHD